MSEASKTAAFVDRAIEHIPAGDRFKSRAEAKAEPARRRKILIGWPPNRPRSPQSAGGGRVARDTFAPYRLARLILVGLALIGVIASALLDLGP